MKLTPIPLHLPPILARNARRKGLLFLGLLLLLAACLPQPVRLPEVVLLGGEITGLSLFPEPTLHPRLHLAFQNPNPYPLPLERLGVSLALEEWELPLNLTLPPGESRASLPLDLPASKALAVGQALFSQGARLQVKARLLQPVVLLDQRLRLPLQPPQVEWRGLHLVLKNPNPLPLRAEGQLVLMGQRFSVKADLPALGESRLELRGFQPGLGREKRLELWLEVPGFFRYTLTLGL
ncbi:MAG: hypothetical protein ACUVUP_00370 [Thermaceae bacterium]